MPLTPQIVVQETITMTQERFSVYFMYMTCRENTPTQALAKVLNFTFGCGLGSQTGTYYLHPSVSALGASTSAPAAGREHLWLNQLFLSLVFFFFTAFLPLSLSYYESVSPVRSQS